MGVNYLQTTNRRVIKNYTNTACYSDVFTYGLKPNTTKLFLYQKTLNLSEDDCKKWVDELNLLGFPCEFFGKEIPEEYKFISKYLNNGDYIFYINCCKYRYKNHLASTLTMLRYLFEYPYEKIVEKYLLLRTEYPKKNKFKLLQLSFLYTNSSGGHTLHYGKPRCFATKKEIMSRLKSDTKIRESGTNLHNSWYFKNVINGNINKDNILKTYRRMNSNLKNVYVVGGDVNYANWFDDYKITKKLEDSDLVIFTGGEDVHPSLYGEPVGKRTYCNLKRDLAEKKIFEKAKALKIPMIGICRGSQFLCVMNGGKLVQHQNNPEYIHDVKTAYHGTLKITSTHHQAAYPFNLSKYEYNIIGWTENLSEFHLDGNDNELKPEKECEIVEYYRSKSLGIQGHPEHLSYQKDYPESINTLKKIVNNFLNNY